MAFIPVPDVAEVTIRFTYFSQVIVNTLYFNKTGGFSGSDLPDLATAVMNWWSTRMKGRITNQCALISVVARDISAESAPVSEVFPVSPIAGTVDNPGLPGNVCWTIQFKTGLAGRSYRGRNYIGALPENAVDGNQIQADDAAAFLAAYVALNSDINLTIAATHVVVSRYHNNAPRTTGVATAVESYGFVDFFLDSQRRRLTGRGT